MEFSTRFLAVLSPTYNISLLHHWNSPILYLFSLLAIFFLYWLWSHDLLQSFVMLLPCLNSSVSLNSFSSFPFFRTKSGILNRIHSSPQLGLWLSWGCCHDGSILLSSHFLPFLLLHVALPPWTSALSLAPSYTLSSISQFKCAAWILKGQGF